MLDFLWHLRGSVPLDAGGSDTDLLERVEQLLDGQGTKISRRGSDQLAFNHPIWSGSLESNWPALSGYDRGRFWIERGLEGRRLRYDLRSLHGMIFCLFAAAGFFFFGLGVDGLAFGLKLAAAMFAWIYGMNALVSFFRVPSVIRKAVACDEPGARPLPPP